MNNILLMGGTGAMGEHLTALLSENPDNMIYITSRSHRDSHDNVTYICGNARDDGFIQSVLRQRHWTAIVDFMIYDTETFRRKMDAFLASTDQYVYISSSRVYARSETPLTEDSERLLDVCDDKEYLKTDEYALTKARQEDILKSSGKTNWTIVRPYITFSEIRLQLGVLEKEGWLYRALQGRTIVFSKDIMERRTTLTYGYDVSRGINSLIGNTKALGQTFHITTGESHTWAEILQVYVDCLGRHLGKKPKVLLLDNHPQRHGGKPNYQLIYDRLYDRLFDNSKIVRGDMSTFRFTPTLDGLKDCLEAFLANPHFRSINWGTEAKNDRLAGEHSRYREFPNVKTYVKYLIRRYVLSGLPSLKSN